MPIQVLMPALSPTMTEGKLAKWLKAEGDDVSAGDVIAEIETDKATMEVEAVDEGKVGKLLVDEGAEGVAVNTPIAVLLAEGEEAGALDGMVAPAPAASRRTGRNAKCPCGNGYTGCRARSCRPAGGGRVDRPVDQPNGP